MVTSIDGRVTGDFLTLPECAGATEIYYRLNREMRSDGFICGRITMEGSFTGGYYPDLEKYSDFDSLPGRTDYISDARSGFYAVAFDTHGRLGWRSNKIIDPDGDPGYDGAEIIEVLSEDVDPRYLAYLREKGISYIFAGKSSIDVGTALSKLKTLFGCERLLLEGGSILNGAFLRADAVDELSIVSAPLLSGAEGKPLFTDPIIRPFELLDSKTENGNLILSYKLVK